MPIIDYLYPKHCPVCLSALPPGDLFICPPCEKKLRVIQGPTCFKCGKPLLAESAEYCRNCQTKKPSFTEGIAFLDYTSYYTREFLTRVKYHGDRQLLDYPCMRFMKEKKPRILKWNAEALIPVPVHRSRLLKRGYNQAEEIALRFQKELRIPVDTTLLLRNRKTKAQKALGNESRALNLYKAFSASGRSPYKTVILIDDIYTTGATAEACTRVLLSAGVEKVYFLSMAIGRDDRAEL